MTHKARQLLARTCFISIPQEQERSVARQLFSQRRKVWTGIELANIPAEKRGCERSVVVDLM